MARIDDLLINALNGLPPKPDDNAPRHLKQQYSQKVSEVVALAVAEELRHRGMRGARPAPPGVLGGSGAERRMSGGIGAKKVDVTWATEESGLLLAVSIKSINFRDGRSNNFQKNLINRRGDMLMEAVTLHRRFPYAVIAGLIFLDKGAQTDDTLKRRSTFLNAHNRLRIFTGRGDPAGRDEQFEVLYILLLDASPFGSSVTAYEVGDHLTPVSLERVFDKLVEAVAERNPDFYEAVEGSIRRAQ
ncbi:MAG TPA: hypothetical protein VF167_08140 [Longimicrobiaceae bacterium]